jgi:hypothetical protein
MIKVFLPENIKGALETPLELENGELEQMFATANEFVIKMSQMKFDNL